MEYLNLPKKNHAYSGAFAFTDVCPKRFKKGFDCGPFNTPANRSGKNLFKCFLMFALHEFMVLLFNAKSIIIYGVPIPIKIDEAYTYKEIGVGTRPRHPGRFLLY